MLHWRWNFIFIRTMILFPFIRQPKQVLQLLELLYCIFCHSYRNCVSSHPIFIGVLYIFIDVQLNLHVTDLLFRYLSHHLTWHCFSISKDLHRFARNLQHMSTKLFLLLFLNNFSRATHKNNNKSNFALICFWSQIMYNLYLKAVSIHERVIIARELFFNFTLQKSHLWYILKIYSSNYSIEGLFKYRKHRAKARHKDRKKMIYFTSRRLHYWSLKEQLNDLN